MKYFLDTEFIEGFQKPLFGKRRHFIDLISLALVREDGALYCSISNEYRYKDADQWVKENVIAPLYISTVHGDLRNRLRPDNFHKYVGQPNGRIVEDLIHFFREDQSQIEIYAYYADYDWVVFCSLFGRMINLPGNLPMYCKDLKQMLDEKYQDYVRIVSDNGRVMSIVEPFEKWKKANVPPQKNEHDALNDALWNRDLYQRMARIVSNSGQNAGRRPV